MPLLTVNNLTTAFHTRDGVVTAVNNLSFSVRAGEVLGIVGESGSGKSVCCYSLLGLLPSPPAKIMGGTALFNGQDLLALSQAELRQLRGSKIGMVFQDPMTSLNPSMRIIDQVAEPLRIHFKLDKNTARERAILALEEVGVVDARQRAYAYPHEFSGGMRQRAMIAMALIAEPVLLIADEPTTALDVTLQAQILDLISALQKKRNLAVILISHDLAVVAKMANAIVVMKDGELVETGPTAEILARPQNAYTQALIAAMPRGAKLSATPVNHSAAEGDSPLLLEVKNIYTRFIRYGGWLVRRKTSELVAVNNLSFSVSAGEVVGIVGESGSGKSTLGRSILRLIQPDSGQVLFAGQDVLRMTPRELKNLRPQIQMIFQDPYASLDPRQTVFDILAEPLLLHGLAEGETLGQEVQTLMDEVGLARSAVRKYPHEFSGGQRQRIAIGRALALKPKLIVADEPVSALDVTIQKQILQLLQHLSEKYQLAIVFISHDLSVVRKMCDRVIVMHKGEKVEEGSTEEIFAAPKHPYTIALLSAALQ